MELATTFLDCILDRQTFVKHRRIRSTHGQCEDFDPKASEDRPISKHQTVFLSTEKQKQAGLIWTEDFCFLATKTVDQQIAAAVLSLLHRQCQTEVEFEPATTNQKK